MMDSPALVARPVADSLDELLGGAHRQSFVPADARSPAGFERVEIDGERCVVKYVHPDLDFTMRVSGDLGCRPRRVWEAGLMDLAPDTIDHAVLGVARWGRNGWGAALLMRDVSDDLPVLGDEPIDEELHAAFLDGIAALATPLWDFQGDVGLLPHRLRWAWFGPDQLAGEERLGFPEAVPRIATEGWQRFAARTPGDVLRAVEALRRDPLPLSEALQSTPQTFVHGDWKIGNLGYAADKWSCSTGHIRARVRSAMSWRGISRSTGRGSRSATPRNRRSRISALRSSGTASPLRAGGIAN